MAVLACSKMKPEPVYCDQCGTIIGEIRDDRVVVFSRHHGHRHQTVLVQGLTNPGDMCKTELTEYGAGGKDSNSLGS